MELLSRSAFHSLESESIIVETVASLRASNLQGTTFVGNLPRIQLSRNKQTYLPSPILHSIPFSMTILALRILCHAKEPFELFASNTNPDGKNLALNTLKNSEVLSICSPHTCLANIASLNLTKSLKPNPPSDLCLHNVSKFFQWIFLRSPLSPHQNLWISISMAWHNPTGSLKQLIAKVGMAYTITFNRTSLPIWVNNFSFHPYNLLHTLSLM